jgi:hypothetical protein
MVQSGTIFEIIKVNEDTIQIILNKRDRGKPYLSAITLFGYWKDKALNLGLRPKDKIKTNVRIRSNEYKGKYYDQQMGREIYIVDKAPYKVDVTTGELFD